MPAKHATPEIHTATGRRKTAVARVFLKSGSGQFVINGRTLNEYFGRETARMVVRQPFELLDLVGRFDITATVKGGGNSAQAGAIRHGITHALLAYEGYDQASNTTEAGVSIQSPMRSVLRKAGCVTRDSRKVERKKIGRHKARKGTQYSKR